MFKYASKPKSSPKKADQKESAPKPSGLKQPEVRSNLRVSNSKSATEAKKIDTASSEEEEEEEEEEGEVVMPRKRRIISEITVSST
ncbi:unnamed protein product [Anisakis simplex]|nr:unnamed protein product [Anisakis simplex]